MVLTTAVVSLQCVCIHIYIRLSSLELYHSVHVLRCTFLPLLMAYSFTGICWWIEFQNVFVFTLKRVANALITSDATQVYAPTIR